MTGVLFTLADPEFYETPHRNHSIKEYEKALDGLVPESWIRRCDGPWIHQLFPGSRAMEMQQGWKIHISTHPRCAKELIEVVVSICVEEKVNFKVLRDPEQISLAVSKRQSRGSSGKAITIYPESDADFVSLLEVLHSRTKDRKYDGPFILSDRRYKNSRVIYYRYGGFVPLASPSPDGTLVTYLTSPQGDLHADIREPYFQCPAWIDDPIRSSTSNVETGDSETSLFFSRFRIDGALGFSNSGGVYFGLDRQSDCEVILKEARPVTNVWRIGDEYIDAIDILRGEYAVLQRLEDSGFTPIPVLLFQESEHHFLVESRVPGISFGSFWARDEVILAPYVELPGRLTKFVHLFVVIVRKLLDAITEIHRRGVVISDLSPNNIVIDPLTEQVSLIDFENAYIETHSDGLRNYAVRWGTPGYARPDRSLRRYPEPRDDWFSLGRVLLGSMTPLNNLPELDQGCSQRFLHYLTSKGLPIEVALILQSLEDGNAEGARSLLNRLEI
jgi:hypothetical protein